MVNSPFQPGARVCAYLRDSGHEEQDLSVEQQESEIRAWCLASGLLLTHVYTDAAAPGSTTVGRDAFLEMIHAFRAPDCPEAGLVVWKFNRFARDIDDAQFYKADLRRRGYIIHSINDQVPAGLDGRFFEAAVDWMNARYLEDLSADVKRGQHHLVAQHGALGGLPPRGFKREAVKLPAHRDGSTHIVHRWVPDPDLVDRVQLAWRMRAAGASYIKINQVTNLYKSTAAYERFFSNKLYIGVMQFSDQVVENYCPPIIDQETWLQVQAIQQRSKKAVSTSADHPRRNQSIGLLSGLIHCARCGSAMNAETVQFRGTAKYRYEYYTCNGISRHTCDQRKIPRAPVDNTVIEQLAEIILAPEYLFALRQERIAENANVGKQRKTERTRLSRTLAALRARIKHTTDLATEPGSPRALLAKLTELESEETALLTQITAIEKPLQPVPAIEEIAQNARKMRNILADGSNPHIPAILRGIIFRITVDVVDPGKTITGMIEYFDPLNAYRASGDALYDAGFYASTQCPGRVPKYTRKFMV
jgi:DNA invertase Pin-like site-specific DNA recombinase